MRRILTLALFAAALWARPAAAAEELVSGLSTDFVQITSNFAGTEIVLFGAIENSDPFAVPADHDIVLVVRGPETDMIVRRRERFLAIWVNAEQVLFTGLPGYYYLASTKPLEDIATPLTLERFGLGMEYLRPIPQRLDDPDQAAEFQAAIVRNMVRNALYLQTTNGIEFLSRTLFRARVPLPATVPPGQYRAEVYLFDNGTVISAQSTPLFVEKIGLERELYNMSHEATLAYGLMVVFLSFFFGWLGYVFFRQR